MDFSISERLRRAEAASRPRRRFAPQNVKKVGRHWRRCGAVGVAQSLALAVANSRTPPLPVRPTRYRPGSILWTSAAPAPARVSDRLGLESDLIGRPARFGRAIAVWSRPRPDRF